MSATADLDRNALRQRREALGLRQIDVAQAAGLTRQHVIQLEAGRVTLPNWPMVARLARVLDCEPAEIFPVAAIDEWGTA